METSLGLSYTVLYGNPGISKNTFTSLWNVVPNSEINGFVYSFAMARLPSKVISISSTFMSLLRWAKSKERYAQSA